MTIPKEELADIRKALIHEVKIRAENGTYQLVVITGEYEDGRLAELFIEIGLSGGKSRALHDSVCTAVSLALQHGVPLDTFVSKFTRLRYEPSGFVEGMPEALWSTGRSANSPLDYAFRWLEWRYPDGCRAG